jgi:hypothetical protein
MPEKEKGDAVEDLNASGGGYSLPEVGNSGRGSLK